VLETQARLLAMSRGMLLGKHSSEDAGALRQQEVQQLAQMVQALATEAPESYQVHEQKHNWERLHGLCSALMESIDRLAIDLKQISGIDWQSALPNLTGYFDALGKRLDCTRQALDAAAVAADVDVPAVPVSESALSDISPLQSTAIALVRKDLESIAQQTRSIKECVNSLADEPAVQPTIVKPHTKVAKTNNWTPPVIDQDQLKGSLWAGLAVFAGFLVYVYVNPPGHSSWFSFTASLAMAVAGTQQLRISIQNQQHYDFAAMANGMVFTILAFAFLYALSYGLSSSRPEKVVLRLLDRFFRSIEYQLTALADSRAHTSSRMRRWKLASAKYEMRTLPAKIATWGHFIDQKMFPANSSEHIQALVNSLQVLAIRVESMTEAADSLTDEELVSQARSDLTPWLNHMQQSFASLSKKPETGTGDDEQRQQYLTAALGWLEDRLGQIRHQLDSRSLDSDGEAFLRMIGGMKGVMEASVAYAGAAGNIDWAQWREEKFT